MPTPYDYNLILALPTGEPHERAKIADDVWKISASVATHQRDGEVKQLVILPEELTQGMFIQDLWRMRFQELNDAPRSRLVLFAHGDPTRTRLADRTGERMA